MKNKFLKITSLFAIMTLISRILAVLRDSIIASNYGTTYITDSFFVATSVPTIIFELLAAAIATIFIPILSEIRAKEGENEMIKFANNLVNFIFIISIILFIFSEIFSSGIVSLIAPSFRGQSRELTLILTKISLFNILVMGIVNSFTAILHIFNCFVPSSIAAFIMNLLSILYMVFLGDKFGIKGLVFSQFISYIIQIIIQLYYLKKNNYSYKFILDISDKRIQKCLYMLPPVILGTGISQLNNIIDKIMASGLSAGSISSYTFAAKLSNIINSVFAYTIITVSFPKISYYIKEQLYDDLKIFLEKVLNQIFILLIPLTFLLIINKTQIVSLLFKRGAFDDRSVIMTSNILVFISIAIAFTALRDIVNKIYYSFNDTRTPMYNSVQAMILNIILNIVLVKVMGIYGLAIATSISIIFGTVCITYKINMSKELLNIKSMLKSILKIIFSSLIMGMTNKYLNSMLLTGSLNIKYILILCFNVLISLIVYAMIMGLLNIKNIKRYLAK